MMQASKAYALLQGRDFVTPEDIKFVARICASTSSDSDCRSGNGGLFSGEGDAAFD